MSFVKRRVVRRELLKGQWTHGRMDAISPYTYLQDSRTPRTSDVFAALASAHPGDACASPS